MTVEYIDFCVNIIVNSRAMWYSVTMNIVKRSLRLILCVVAVVTAVIILSVGTGSTATIAEASTAPTISVDNETGWVKSVMVTIDYDESSPQSRRYYAVGKMVGETFTGTKKLYTVPFSVDTEGDVYIRAYYYDSENIEYYVEKKISNIDKTAPLCGTTEVTVDLTKEATLFLTVNLSDALSGVKTAYIDLATQIPLEVQAEAGGRTYGADVTRILGRDVQLVVEDYAGNRISQPVSLVFGQYYEDVIRKYRAKYSAIDFDEYTEVGINQINQTFSRLSFELTARRTVNADNTQTVALTQEADSAIEGALKTTTKIESKPENGMFLDFKASVIAGRVLMKKGDTLNVTVKKSVFENDTAIAEALGNASEYAHYGVYAFNLDFSSAEGEQITLNLLPVTVSIPNDRFPIQVYSISADGTITRLQSTINEDDMTVTFYVDEGGDFAIIGVEPYTPERGKGLTIGDKFYSLELILTAVGIIVGVALLSGVITFTILKLRSRKS